MPQKRAKLNLGPKFYTKPMEGYRKIVCPLTEKTRARARKDCWNICGLTCAKVCFRAPDSMCDGCPCLSIKNKGGKNG